jgi:hypothetical protein
MINLRPALAANPTAAPATAAPTSTPVLPLFQLNRLWLLLFRSLPLLRSLLRLLLLLLLLLPDCVFVGIFRLLMN